MSSQIAVANLRPQTTYKLVHPITKGDGEVVHEINVRRVKASDLRDFESKKFDTAHDNIKMSFFYLTKLTGLVPEDIDELDVTDFNALSEIVVEVITEGKS